MRRTLWGALLLASVADAALAQGAGPWDVTFDWLNANNVRTRNLTFCVDPALAANLKAAIRTAATTLNAAGTGWTLTETKNAMGVIQECPAGWKLRPPFLAGQANLRIRMAALPVPPPKPGGRGGNAPSAPYDKPGYPSYRPYDPYEPPRKPNPNDQPGMPPGGGGMPGAPAGGGATLAYFQAGPAVAGRLIRSGEVVYNSNVLWNTPFGTFDYDPIITGMHELGHAIRLDHDAFAYNDDRQLEPCGSKPPAPPAPALPQDLVVVTRGADAILQTPVIPDDVRNMAGAGDITVGMNLFVNSGQRVNVMEPEGVPGEHCINPINGAPANAQRAYAPREKNAAVASAAAMNVPRMGMPGRPGMMPAPGMPGPGPAMPGPRMMVAGGLLRDMDWAYLKLQDVSGTAVLEYTYAPGHQDGTPETDFVEESTPDASAFVGLVTASSPIDLPGATEVQIEGTIGSAPLGTVAALQLDVPFSPDHPSLRVVADWAADTVTVYEGGSVLCGGALSSFHPVDCAADPENPSFFSAGFVNVVLTKTSY